MNRLAAALVCIVLNTCVASIAVAAEPGASVQTRAATARGKVSIGGAFAVSIDAIVPDGDGDSTEGVRLIFAPAIGYFVADGFEIGFEAETAIGIGELYERRVDTLAMSLRLRYFFGSSKVLPFVGVGVGPQLWFADGRDTLMFFDVKFHLGLQVMLTPSVGLTIGVRPTISVGLSEQAGATLFTMPVGWLGVQGAI